MAEKAGFGINPNAYGLSAAGQEGSGMNQILTPYDPTKFDKAIVAAGEKAKEDTLKQKNVAKSKVEFTDIKKGWQGYFVEEGITIDEKQTDLAKRSIDWQIEYIQLDPKSSDYESVKTDMMREYADIEYEIQSLNFTADQMIQNKEVIDKSTNSLMLNGNKYDLDASADLAQYVKNLPTDQQTQYLQNNILNVPKVDFDWNKNFLTPTGGYIKGMFEQTIGSPITGSTVDENGNFIYKTQKGTNVPLAELRPTLEALLTDIVATTPGLYDYLLGRTNAEGKSYAQLAAEARYDNGNVASFVKYLVENQTEEFVKQVIPLGDNITTQQIIQPYKGGSGSNTTVVVNSASVTTSGGGQGGFVTPNANFGDQNVSGGYYTTYNQKDSKATVAASPDYVNANGTVVSGSKYTNTVNTAYNNFITFYPNDKSIPPQIRRAFGMSDAGIVTDDVLDKIFSAPNNPLSKEALKYIDIMAISTGLVKDGNGTEAEGVWKIQSSGNPDYVKQEYQNQALQQANFKYEYADNISNYPNLLNGESRASIITIKGKFPEKSYAEIMKELSIATYQYGTQQQRQQAVMDKFGGTVQQQPAGNFDPTNY